MSWEPDPPPPPAGGLGVPPEFPPPRHERASRPLLIVLGVVLVVAALGVGGYLMLVDGDDDAATAGSPHTEDAPTEWDPAVEDIAEWVADERGLAWEHPVPIRYLDDAAFVEELTADLEDPDDEDREELEHSQALFQALGLIGADVDLLEEITGAMGSGVLAYYDYEVGEIVMRGDEITPALRATLAHELTHALQDQHFGLEGLYEEAGETGGSLALSAVVEGDAGRVEDAYVATLTPEERALVQDYGADTNAAIEGLADVDDAVLAMFTAPYIVGPTFLEMVAMFDSEDAIDDLFVPDTPEIALVAPTRFLAATDDGLVVDEVEAPPLPEGADAIDDPEAFGALGLYMVLAGRGDPLDALDAVHWWSGDSMQLYSLDGATCVAAAFRGIDENATAAIDEALRAWAAAGPPGQATIGERDGDVVLDSCSRPDTPGPTGSISDAVMMIALRHALYLGMSGGVLDLDDATCIVDRLMAQPELRDLLRDVDATTEPSPSETQLIQSLGEEAALACLR